MAKSKGLEELRKDLANDDGRVRNSAVRALKNTDSPEALELLHEVLAGDEVPDIRALAARVLGQLRSPQSLEPLAKALEDINVDVRQRAARALSGMPDEAIVKPLVSVLADEDRDVRLLAARTLGVIGRVDALDGLEGLRRDSKLVVRDEADNAIQAIRERNSLEEHKNEVTRLRKEMMAVTENALEKERLGGRLALESLNARRLEARLAAREIAPIGEVPEEQRERLSEINRLERLIRELESLGQSADFKRFREAWQNEVDNAKALLSDWMDGDEVDTAGMRSELDTLITRKDDLFEQQRNDLADLIRFIQEAYHQKIRLDQMQAGFSDPANKLKMEAWLLAAETHFEMIRNARESGDVAKARDHASNMDTLLASATELDIEEERSQKKAGQYVIVAVLVFVVLLPTIIWMLTLINKAGNLQTLMIPILNIPYGVVLWSAIGAVAAMLYQFIHRPVSQLETIKWLVARPIQGTLMGCLLYLFFAAGLFTLSQGAENGGEEGLLPTLPQNLAAVIGFLGGFSDRFAEQMVRRATSILTTEESASEKEDKPAS